MPNIAELIQQGSANLWVFVPSAILLGVLHGLEPGHSKTMMASFIIAVRGTIGQAVLLGLCAALSHSLIVWLLAVVALEYGNALIAEQAEPYFMLLSSVIVLGVAGWMFWRTREDNRAAQAQVHAPHGGMIINTGHGFAELEVHEDGVPPRFRLHLFDHAMQARAAESVRSAVVETLRPDGSRQVFQLVSQGAFLESGVEIPEPHEFEAIVTLGHAGHEHRYEVGFSEDGHGHGHGPHGNDHHHHGHGAEYEDAHERAHAEDIKRRFAGREVSTGQIAMFGLTGGLVPCPASVTVLMVCLHLKRLTLGVAMVGAFSFGLALAMVSVGVAAAWGARQVGKRFGNLSAIARKTPYASSALMVVVALIMAFQAAAALRG